ncbi:MAG: hypothetical protein ACOX4U_00450 [Anaerovoracaceae bacterium]|jgi:hypothetical protein
MRGGIMHDPYAPYRVCDIRATFEMIDTTAADDVIVVVTGESEVSKAEQTYDGFWEMDRKLASFEHNILVLDGSFDLPSDDNGQVGYISEQLSDGDGSLSDIVEFTFAQKHSSFGFTVCFDNKSRNYAKDFDVTAYDTTGMPIKTLQVRGNKSVVCVVDMPTPDYSAIRITFLKTSIPFRRIRLTEFVFGVIYRYGREYGNMLDVHLTYESDLIGESFPSGEVTMTINNQDHRYNLINPTGVYQYLQQGQKITYEMGVGSNFDDVEYVKAGTFFYTSSATADDSLTAQITANDKVMGLNKGKYRKGKNITGTLSEILTEIMEESDARLTLDIREGVGDRVIGWNIPVVSPREAVRMAAQAAMAVCYISRDNELVVTDLPDYIPIGEVRMRDMYHPANVIATDYYNTVECKGFNYRNDGSYPPSKSEVYNAEMEIMGIDTIWIDYDAVSSPSATITNGTLIAAEYYLYSCRLTISGMGTVTIKIQGYRLSLAESVHKVSGGQDDEDEYVYAAENQLVRSDNAVVWGEWVLSNLQRRLRYSMQERGNPCMEILDVITVADSYGENKAVYVEKQQYHFVDGVLTAETKGVT